MPSSSFALLPPRPLSLQPSTEPAGTGAAPGPAESALMLQSRQRWWLWRGKMVSGWLVGTSRKSILQSKEWTEAQTSSREMTKSLTKRGVQTSKVKGLHELISVSGVIKCGLPQGCDEASQGRRKPTGGRCAGGRGISR